MRAEARAPWTAIGRGERRGRPGRCTIATGRVQSFTSGPEGEDGMTGRTPGETPLEGWVRLEHDGTPVWVHPATPDWFVPNRRADAILRALAGGSGPAAAAARYAAEFSLPEPVAMAQTLRFLERIPRRPPEPLVPRAGRLRLDRLDELWLHLTNRCNLRCAHCMFASCPEDALELETRVAVRAAREAAALGCRLFYATGGEPLVHPGYAELARFVAASEDRHLVTLTNGVAVGRVRALLEELPRERFHFQVSLDGPEPVHDALRGEGSYRRAAAGIRELRRLGFPLALAMVVERGTVAAMPWLVEEAARLGVEAVHFLWYFARGKGDRARSPEPEAVAEGLLAARAAARTAGVSVDNVEILHGQVLSLPGTRYDLTNAGWRSLAVGPDGRVYPTAALVLDPALAGLHVREGLDRAWRESPPLDALRRASVAHDPETLARPLALLLGGGDPDHSWVAGRRFVGADPWLPVYERVALALIAEQAGPEDAAPHPALRARMGERLEACSEEDAVCAFTHSNCVLSLAGDDGHTLARTFYAEAAARPDEALRNPAYADADLEAVPAAARARSYGCGSPVLDAGLAPGERVVDLGCGAGLEVCLAAEKVGPEGRVVGVDMLDEMLELAREAARETADRLGYANVELRRGLLEAIPLPDGWADAVISNCVINLAADKRRTFEEIRRVLRPGGRLVVADVCCEEEPPLEIRYSEKLRGECLGGAMRQEELLALLEDVGFEHVTVLGRFPYREVRGHRFHSLTYVAFAPGAATRRAAIYRGPFAAAVTPGGELIVRGRTARLAVPEDSPDASVFLLDDGGAVTNVDIGAGCTCFVPPDAPGRDEPARRLTEAEGCMVCGAPLVYLETAEGMTCAYCGRELPSSARCEAGHFVCDACHAGDALEVIATVLEASPERDMVRLLAKVRRHPAIPVHGPEHHALVPAVIVTAARNSGMALGARHLRTAIERGRTVAGGACGFLGACGAALGVGAAFSVILGANPYRGDLRRRLHEVTTDILREIGELAAARCCQRDSWIALRGAARWSREVLGVELPADEPLACDQFRTNRDCLRAACPLWPRAGARRAAGASLPVLPLAGATGDGPAAGG